MQDCKVSIETNHFGANSISSHDSLILKNSLPYIIFQKDPSIFPDIFLREIWIHTIKRSPLWIHTITISLTCGST
jgi:hypothetical protein